MSTPEIKALLERIEALEALPRDESKETAQAPPEITKLLEKMGALEGQVNDQSKAIEQGSPELKALPARIDKLEGKVDDQFEAIEQGSLELKGLPAKIDELERAVAAGHSEDKRYDLSEKLINGLLAANEHLDDKAGRILSAMAFLTAAAAALFTKAYSPSPPAEMIRRKLYEVLPTAVGVDVTNAINKVTWDVPHASILGVEWSLVTFAIYMLLVLVGAVLYLTALGPFLNISKAWHREITPDRTNDKSLKLSSLLFFYFVAEISEKEWEAYWLVDRTEEQLASEITSNQIKESRMIAQNARAKYGYLSVGSIFFILAIFCLMALVAGILSTDNRVAGLLTMIGGIAWSITLAVVTKVRPPKESKSHWLYVGVTILLATIAAILSFTIWFR